MNQEIKIKCPLCQNFVSHFHKRSHIIPEWMYKDVYDHKHKIINVDLETEYANKKQKGYYDQIICPKCEEESQLFDHYASLILTNRSTNSNEYLSIKRKDKENIRDGKYIKYAIWENIDFLKLQKFVFICLLRTHLSMVKEGKPLLIERQFKKIRELYNDPIHKDDSSYPIMISIFLDDDFKDTVCLPFINKKDGHFLIEFAGAGYFFWIFISSHEKPKYINSLRLKSNGNAYLLKNYFRQTGTFKTSAETIQNIAQKFPCD